MSQTWEETAYYKGVDWRTKILKPIAKPLAALGVTPNMVTYTGVLLMLVFVAIAPTHAVAGFWLIVAVVFLDMLDGSLARIAKVGSDRGKFTDTLADNLNSSLFIFGALRAGLVSGLPAAVFVYFMLLAKVLLIVKKNLGKKSDWLIRPFAGALPNSLVFSLYILFGWHAFAHHNYLNEAVAASAALLAAKATLDFFVIRYRRFPG